MAIAAAHLLDRVLPDVAVRQWVLSLPFDLRFLLATDRSILSDTLRIFIDVVFAYYRARVGVVDAECGAVAFIQRFDSALNLNVHFHVLVLDGAYVGEKDQLRFSNARQPTEKELKALSAAVAIRVKRLLLRRGLVDELGWCPSEDIDDAGRALQERLRFGWLLEDGRVVHDDPLEGTGPASSAEFAGFSYVQLTFMCSWRPRPCRCRVARLGSRA